MAHRTQARRQQVQVRTAGNGVCDWVGEASMAGSREAAAGRKAAVAGVLSSAAPSTAQRVGEAWRCAKRKAAVAGIPSSAAPSTAPSAGDCECPLRRPKLCRPCTASSASRARRCTEREAAAAAAVAGVPSSAAPSTAPSAGDCEWPLCRPELCCPLHHLKRRRSAALHQERGGGRSSGCGRPELRRSIHRPKRQRL
uniref:Uncharacterized protein n=2 Tax=Oryza sativa subsp. japonica TaxID=39947 RepID=Q2R818_ORYSJ|nr:hypothetical protein LOC_Os11g14200 [Oryza sativa Japonica Group]ABA92350.1 hypothetical protein LOC_Os11g14200 [Oryza sativa Japonica Group]